MRPFSDVSRYRLALGFETLIEAQRELQLEMPSGDPSKLAYNAQKIDFIRWNILAIEDELHEALAEIGWKPWATSDHINRDAFIKELVDALHFFANLCLVLDITGDELAMAYRDKRKRNQARQKEGYTGLDKCLFCGRDYAESNCYPGVSANGPYCEEWDQDQHAAD